MTRDTKSGPVYVRPVGITCPWCLKPIRPFPEMSAPPADDPPPVPRRSGCAMTWALLLLAVWVLFIAVVVRVVRR